MTISTPAAPFGRLLTAMVTPFRPDGALDTDGAAALAARLAAAGHDGLVISGTTGESPTTSDDEKDRLLRAVIEAVGDRVAVVAGVGTNDTAHSIELARAAEKAGAAGVLAVTPYYNKPTQAGILAHFRAVADATELPMMLYDIPGRTGVPIASETLLRLAEHPRIVANKDAKGDLYESGRVMARAGAHLAFYSGDDGMTLPLMALGAAGVVSVIAHLVPDRMRALVDAALASDLASARAAHAAIVPVVDAVMTRMPGAVAVKAALGAAGLPGGDPRLPLVPPDEGARAQLLAELNAAGVAL